MDATITLREALAQAPDCQERAKAIVSLLRNGAVLDMPLGAIEQLIVALGERTYTLWASAILAPALTRFERLHLLDGLRSLPSRAEIWQAEALGYLAPYLPAELINSVLKEAWRIASCCRSRDTIALLQAKIAARMGDELRASFVPQVYTQALHTRDPYLQAQALIKLLELLDGDTLRMARALVFSALARISHPYQRFLIAGRLARLSETAAERIAMLHAAIDAIEQSPDPKAQQWMLHVLNPLVSEGAGKQYNQLRLRWIMLSDAATMALAFLNSAEDQDATADYEL